MIIFAKTKTCWNSSQIYCYFKMFTYCCFLSLYAHWHIWHHKGRYGIARWRSRGGNVPARRCYFKKSYIFALMASCDIVCLIFGYFCLNTWCKKSWVRFYRRQSNLIVVRQVEEADLLLEAAEAARGRRQALAAAAGRPVLLLVLLLLGLPRKETMMKSFYWGVCVALGPHSCFLPSSTGFETQLHWDLFS